MGVSRVDFAGETLVDLTNDTVNSKNLLKGATAHGANGDQINGNVVTVPTTTSLAVTEEGVSALDGTVGKVLNDKISVLNNDLDSKANGAFVVLTGTTHTTAGQQTSQNYPSGFNQNNCTIVSVMIKLGQNWYFGNYSSGYTNINAQVILSSQVGIIAASGWTNCQYKIVLYKYI